MGIGMEIGALKITYNGIPLGDAFVRSLGFAFDRTWMNAIFLTPLLEGLIRGFSYDSMATVYLAELTSCSVAFLLAVLLSSHLERLGAFLKRHSYLYQFSGGLCACLGIILIALSSFVAASSAFETTLQIAAGILTGVGEAILILQWGAVFVATNNKTTNAEICLSFILGAAMPALLSLFPIAVRIAVTAAAPIVSAWMIGLAKGRDTIAVVAGDDGDARPGPATSSRMPTWEKAKNVFGIKILLASLILSLTLSLLRIYDDGSLFRAYYDLSPFLAGLLGIVVFSVIGSKLPHEYRFTYRIVISLVFGGVVLMLFVNDYFICDMIARIGLFCFELLFFIMTVNITANLRLKTVKLIALPEFGYMLAELIGSVFIWTKPAFSLADQNSWFVGIMLASLFFVYCYILSENDIVNVESWGLYPEPDADEDDADADLEVRTGSNYMTTMREFASVWSQFLAEEHGLSEREKEIVVCLALGYSRNQIQEDLFISQGTVNTHISHIYQKLDIHSRGELQERLSQWNHPE